MNKVDYILNVLDLDIENKELSVEDVGQLFKNFRIIKKTLDDYEKKTLKPYFFSGAEQFGHETENGGHRVVLDDGTGWEKQARVKVTVDNEKALELLKDKHLHDYIDVQETIPEENMAKVIDILKAVGREDLIEKEETVEDTSLEQLYLNNQITDEELSSLIERKVTYALVEVKPKKTNK